MIIVFCDIKSVEKAKKAASVWSKGGAVKGESADSLIICEVKTKNIGAIICNCVRTKKKVWLTTSLIYNQRK